MVTLFDRTRNDETQIIEDDGTRFLLECLRTFHPTTYWHSLRVAYLSLMVARTYGMPQDQLQVFFRSALLHDVGKLAIPVQVLDKVGKLSGEEWAQVQTHPQRGAELVQGMVTRVPVDYDVILYHHENIDGSGYPYRKQEYELSLPVRIIRVIDSFDAMTSLRAYNQPMNVQNAVQELYNAGRTSFDLHVVRRFHLVLAQNLRAFDEMTREFCSMGGGKLA